MTNSTINRAYFAAVLGCCVLLAHPMTAAQENASQDAANVPLIGDLVDALTLQGIDCGDVVELDQTAEEAYQVECANGGKYRVEEDGGGLVIFDLIGGVARLGTSAIGHALEVPGKILGLGAGTVTQSSEIARHLFGIVRLSGRQCNRVVNVDRRAEDDHIVTCGDGASHHVYTDVDGLVVVEDPSSSHRINSK